MSVSFEPSEKKEPSLKKQRKKKKWIKNKQPWPWAGSSANYTAIAEQLCADERGSANHIADNTAWESVVTAHSSFTPMGGPRSEQRGLGAWTYYKLRVNDSLEF